jgi:hypothetical protein
MPGRYGTTHLPLMSRLRFSWCSSPYALMACTRTLTFEKQAESTRVIWRFHIFVGILVEEFLFDCLEDGSNKFLGNICNKLLPTRRHLRINLSELFCMKHEPKGACECSVRLMFKIGQETSEIPRGFPQLIQAYICLYTIASGQILYNSWFTDYHTLRCYIPHANKRAVK